MTNGLGDRVVSFAQRNMGERVGRGECFDLADAALRAAGARTASDYGDPAETNYYESGEQVDLADVQVGDIVQMESYTVRVTGADGSWREETRPHHTVIVASVGDNGAMEVYEQNVGGVRRVQRNRLYFSDSNAGGGNVRVTGSFWFYRPQAR